MEERKRYRGRRRGMDRRALVMLTAVCVVVLALVVGLALALSMRLELTMSGDAEMTLEYGTSYVEPGASATLNGKPTEVITEGAVDNGKLGTYTITYRASYLWLSETAQRVVHIVDTQAPVITLTETDQFTLPGEEYVEEGFVATDNYDGDITAKVDRRVEVDKVYYTVSDSSGNQTTVIRTITYGDVTPPVITLKGDSEITIMAGDSFKDPGFTAVDNVDGDITDKVEVSGKVENYSAGTYTLTYTVTDSFGNTAKVERKVVVKPYSKPSVEPSGDKVIYLTFDDGPSSYTRKLLNVLARYDVKATFFVVNTGYKMDELLNAIVDGGHSIGIHSVSHEYSEIYSSDEAFFKDLYAMQKIIKDKTGVTTTLMRFPGGSSNRISKNYNTGIMTRLTKAVEDQGFQYFDWNVSSGDAGGATTADEVFENVVSGVNGKKTSIVLQHDIMNFSVEAVERIIIWGLQNGYTFKALTPNSPTCHHPVKN